ncbi:GH25 family lysozyme [Actinopolymorpha pittospori]|uniref:GH25 family lysozyme M1 (1,4-beta-N-acetylmuramidase) n=1 Tax=Actinopolymorpha pittospori TaxID=648752 RepID=A0A927RK18_9ACTN|nr:GH25 family lysozyme M1 (1,4-beta-N-acetylmuramidase) [Actinopolymorpha pittospori]
MTIVRGIDVSSYQTVTSWSQLKGTIGFVFVKATEGTSFTSSTWRSYFAAACNASLLVGSYHFAHPDQDAKAQAAHYASELQAAGWRTGRDLPPALDLEQTGGLGKSALTAWALAFMQEVDRQLGLAGAVRCGLYVNPDYLTNKTNGASLVEGRWLWLAKWPNPGGPWPSADSAMPAGTSVWQWTDKASVKGVSGVVDGDVSTLAALKRLAPAYYGTTPAPQAHQEDDLPTANEIADAVWAHSLTSLSGSKATAETFVAHIRTDTASAVANAAQIGALRATIDTLAKAVGSGASVDIQSLADAVRAASEAGARAALEDSVVSVDVNVNGKTAAAA